MVEGEKGNGHTSANSQSVVEKVRQRALERDRVTEIIVDHMIQLTNPLLSDAAQPTPALLISDA